MKTNRKVIFFLLLLALVCLISIQSLTAESAAPNSDTPQATPAAAPATPEEPKDITAQVREYNSDQFAPPPADFRQGQVTVRQLDEKAVQKTENGYAVQLPSHAPVATPAVADGLVFVSGGFRSKEFYAFEARTGTLKWAVNLDDDGPSSVVVRDGVVIFNTESCTIFALDAQTGRQLWSWWLGDPLMSMPTIANGRVFSAYPATGRSGGANQAVQMQENAANVNSIASSPAGAKAPPPASHALAAFDLRTGKILWQRWIDADVMSAPVAEGDELFVATFAGTIYRFRQSDGEILSARQARATSAPVVVHGELYYTKRADVPGSGVAEEATVNASKNSGQETRQVNRKAAPYIDSAVQAKTQYKSQGISLDAANGFAGGAPAQSNAEAAYGNIGQNNVSTLQAFQGSRVLTYGDNNYNVLGDEIVCNERKTGEKRWSQPLPGNLTELGGFLGTPPVVAGGYLFIGTVNGEVLQIDPADGLQIKAYPIGAPVRSQPVIEGGFIYVGTQDGRLVAIDTRDEKLTGWPMWGGDAAHTSYREPVAGH
ncbi:MAG: PQQ-binding-like beta-propeller repeat protein [Myxococcales bacterium]|nr:PQQ-binding-like beta-propeller repeat protein [Myxococcales bacterium]